MDTNLLDVAVPWKDADGELWCAAGPLHDESYAVMKNFDGRWGTCVYLREDTLRTLMGAERFAAHVGTSLPPEPHSHDG